MSKPREFWIPLTTLIVNSDSKRPDGMHVIEAAPVLAEIERIKTQWNKDLGGAHAREDKLKKQLAETKKQLDDLIAAELGG